MIRVIRAFEIRIADFINVHSVFHPYPFWIKKCPPTHIGGHSKSGDGGIRTHVRKSGHSGVYMLIPLFHLGHSCRSGLGQNDPAL